MKYFENSESAYKNLPVFKKAVEIMIIVHTLCDIIDAEKDDLRIVERLREHASIIPAKIAAAEGGDIYSIRFDNATIIKLAARELQYLTSVLYDMELCDDTYVRLLRNTIEEFRIEFIDWVESFDRGNDMQDAWEIRDM